MGESDIGKKDLIINLEQPQEGLSSHASLRIFLAKYYIKIQMCSFVTHSGFLAK